MTLTPEAFVVRWRNTDLSERASYQAHFIDLCHLIGVPPPSGTGQDSKGRAFQFEASIKKDDGGQGFADVWYEGHFAIEYKAPGKYATLDEAYNQLKRYRENLNNPPLLIVTDINNWEIHTNFTNAANTVYRFTHDDIAHTSTDAITRKTGNRPLRLLTAIFKDPNSLHPDRTAAAVTADAAREFEQIASAMRNEGQAAPENIAHFLTKIVFCLFAEDVNLLPTTSSGRGLFTEIVEETYQSPSQFIQYMQALFQAMADGGNVLMREVAYFNGKLFEDVTVEELPFEALTVLRRAARLDWSSVEPAIFGTLFERSLDPAKRSQLGAHYTSPQDIMLIVEPVLMEPLRRQWADLQTDAELLRAEYDAATNQRERTAAADKLTTLRDTMLNRLRSLTVLDPACGSGNFLYMSLRALLDLEKQVINAPYWNGDGFTQIMPEVHPRQMYGIEINPIAHDLATIVVWIGWIQWKITNGYPSYPKPILQDLGQNIQNKDAILAFDADGNPVEPEWAAVDVIVGNPPFLGSQRMRGELGDEYLNKLRFFYEGRVSGSADLVTYWFERSFSQLEKSQVKRVGFIATNSIRFGSNRDVLSRVKNIGDIFLAWSDKEWVLDGAAVRVSIIGFDDGSEDKRVLDGNETLVINVDLTNTADITGAKELSENKNLAFQGPVKVGSFDISDDLAQKMFLENPNNALVIKPYMNGADIVRQNRNYWLIDFNNLDELEASKFEAPFRYVLENIKPEREKNNNARRREYWWQLGASGENYRKSVTGIKRQIFTPRVAKYRLFIWVDKDMMPSDALVAITREDDYFFGVLHSRLHEVWSLRMGSFLGAGNDPRYTPTTTFETFPFPWSPGHEPTDHPAHARISAAAAALHTERTAWLNGANSPSPFTGKGLGDGVNRDGVNRDGVNRDGVNTPHPPASSPTSERGSTANLDAVNPPSPFTGKGLGDGVNRDGVIVGDGVNNAGDEVESPWQTPPKLWEALKPLAREMRQDPTPAEAALWEQLRNRQLEAKFRRQHTVDRFIVDFYCAEAKLVIEVDGEIHQYTQEEDAIRQAFLESTGLRVLRFDNDRVLNDMQGVLKEIAAAVNPPSPFTAEGRTCLKNKDSSVKLSVDQNKKGMTDESKCNVSMDGTIS